VEEEAVAGEEVGEEDQKMDEDNNGSVAIGDSGSSPPKQFLEPSAGRPKRKAAFDALRRYP